MSVFRWRSWFGASVILFLFYGALNRLHGRVRAGNVDERRRWGRRSRHHA